jgi:hypothetical protein
VTTLALLLKPSTQPRAIAPFARNLRLLLNAYLQEKEESGELTTLIANTLPFYHETSLFKNK